VSLQYPGASQPSLQAVTLDIPRGARIGVIGAVGSGKTSLVRLISGLYAPDEGAVLLDGLNMAQVEPAVIRRAVQLVPQDPVLFSGTLAENIAFGRPQATDAEILMAARAAGADAIAAASEEGFALRIAERGRNLSGGQRQMVALARALVAQPRVLVLDEPTSSMDQQSERRFIDRLRGVVAHSDMTLVVATHRMGLLDLVDRIVLLDRGRKKADGPKADVIAALEARARGSAP
jgi:ATP-binding cassette subfamily C protein LapB